MRHANITCSFALSIMMPGLWWRLLVDVDVHLPFHPPAMLTKNMGQSRDNHGFAATKAISIPCVIKLHLPHNRTARVFPLSRRGFNAFTTKPAFSGRAHPQLLARASRQRWPSLPVDYPITFWKCQWENKCRSLHLNSHGFHVKELGRVEGRTTYSYTANAGNGRSDTRLGFTAPV